MGQHFAYHYNLINREIHFAMIPLELMGFLCIVGAFPLVFTLPQLLGTCQTLALIVVASVIYVRTDMFCGGSFAVFLILLHTALYAILGALNIAPGWPQLLFGIMTFLIPNQIQTRIGHAKFEPQGRDDTELNLTEFAHTGRVVPILLIFYYHWVELAFICGYNP